MSEPVTIIWQKYGTLAQMAPAAMARARQAFPNTQQWAMKTAAVAPRECKLRKT